MRPFAQILRLASRLLGRPPAGARRWPITGLTTVVLLLAGSPAKAVIFFATGDANYNTTAPVGPLADSGWQWQGSWGGFTGTPIGPHHFIAANHVGGTVGDALVLNGTSYPTTASYPGAGSDLRIWEISGTFPSWAPLFRSSTEVGMPLVVFGRGVSRGGEVRVGSVLKGWGPGGGSGTLRWGENVVAAIVNGGANNGDLLYATFDADGGPNEAHLGVGDSSGAMFVEDGGTWKLAGISLSVDGPFNTTNSGAGFNASIFDAGGLYFLNNGVWQMVPDQPTDIPSGFYATRISAHTAWIDSVLATSASAIDAPLLDNVGLMIFAAALAAAGFLCVAREPRLTGRT